MTRIWNRLASLGVIAATGTLALGTTIALQQGLNGYGGTTDAWLDESAKLDNNGGSNELRVQWYNGRSDATVIKLDLTGQIPPYQEITSATLWLYYFYAGSFTNSNTLTVKAFRLAPGAWWDENVYGGVSGYGVNYTYRDASQTLQWTGGAEGGWWDKIDDGNGVALLKKTGGTDPNAIDPNHWVPFNVAPSVTQWYRGVANNGFLLDATGFAGSGTTVYSKFFSRNEGGSSYRPQLVISYQLDPTPTICRGDCNCDGSVNFADIDWFVLALGNNVAGWTQHYRDTHGGAAPPCNFVNCDINGDGSVTFADIDPFVARLGTTCQW